MSSKCVCVYPKENRLDGMRILATFSVSTKNCVDVCRKYSMCETNSAYTSFTEWDFTLAPLHKLVSGQMDLLRAPHITLTGF